MQVFVYRSRRRPDTYVYLGRRDDFACLPEAVSAPLAPFEFALEFALTPHRTLSRGDATVVRRNLMDRGFHLQLPPPAPDHAAG
ncbi:MAG TPA: YcgL domain-containing protein [Xanthomonadaceae bacterium]|nr:YcgL domain-containing protein [Xanthomonadaceae bacterium]